MTQTMYHGTRTDLALHHGLCLTDSERIAAEYGRNGTVHEVEVNLDSLVIVEVDGFNRDQNLAPGDDDTQHPGVDVLIFTDETINGREHHTWRLMSDAALAAVTIIGATDAEEI